MTNNSPNSSLHHYHVQPGLPKPPASGLGNPFSNPESMEVRTAAALAFGAIYLITRQYGELAPVLILVLLGCVVFRLDSRQRQIAGVPLILAGLRLIQMEVFRFGWASFAPAIAGRSSLGIEGDMGVSWVPMFLAVSLFYMPKKETVTGKIMLIGSILLLASGLLPGEGFLGVFAFVQYTLFLGVVIGLIADFCAKPIASTAEVAAEGTHP